MPNIKRKEKLSINCNKELKNIEQQRIHKYIYKRGTVATCDGHETLNFQEECGCFFREINCRCLRKRTSIFVETLLFVPFILSPLQKPAFRASRTPSSLLQPATFRNKSMMRRGGNIPGGQILFLSRVYHHMGTRGRTGGRQNLGGGGPCRMDQESTENVVIEKFTGT